MYRQLNRYPHSINYYKNIIDCSTTGQHEGLCGRLQRKHSPQPPIERCNLAGENKQGIMSSNNAM